MAPILIGALCVGACGMAVGQIRRGRGRRGRRGRGRRGFFFWRRPVRRAARTWSHHPYPANQIAHLEPHALTCANTETRRIFRQFIRSAGTSRERGMADENLVRAVAVAVANHCYGGRFNANLREYDALVLYVMWHIVELTR